jgi:hypothetical protein
MPKIPVNISGLAIELAPLDESIPYHGIVRNCRLADKMDKHDRPYLTDIRIEILDPEEFKGRAAFINYMVITEEKAQTEMELLFPRFVRAFKVPFDDDGFDPNDAIGCEGDFSVENDIYQGRKVPKVKDFLL